MPAGESIYTKIALARLQTIQFQLAKRRTHTNTRYSQDAKLRHEYGQNQQRTTNNQLATWLVGGWVWVPRLVGGLVGDEVAGQRKEKTN